MRGGTRDGRIGALGGSARRRDWTGFPHRGNEHSPRCLGVEAAHHSLRAQSRIEGVPRRDAATCRAQARLLGVGPEVAGWWRRPTTRTSPPAGERNLQPPGGARQAGASGSERGEPVGRQKQAVSRTRSVVGGPWQVAGGQRLANSSRREWAMASSLRSALGDQEYTVGRRRRIIGRHCGAVRRTRPVAGGHRRPCISGQPYAVSIDACYSLPTLDRILLAAYDWPPHSAIRGSRPVIDGKIRAPVRGGQ